MENGNLFDSRYDALVIGARAAGAATAMLLAQSGLKVLAVDRQSYGSDTVSTHALMRGAVVQLTRWGLLQEIVDAGTPAIRRTTFHYGDEAVGVDIKPGNGIETLFAPRRTLLDRVLVDGARRAGADMRHVSGLNMLEFAGDGRVIGASVRGPDGRSRDIKADIVIGADGCHSSVAKQVEAPKYRQSKHRSAIIYGYFSGLENQGYRWYFRPGTSIGVVPTNDGETCVFASASPDRFRRDLSNGTEALFNTILAETSSDFAEEIQSAGRKDRLHGFPGEEGYFRHSFGPGWALVGDAGYFKDPLTAHGITDALRDAELLTSAVNDGGGHAYERYQDERETLSSDLFQVTDDIASFDWDLESLKDHHQRLSTAMKIEAATIAARPEPLRLAS